MAAAGQTYQIVTNVPTLSVMTPPVTVGAGTGLVASGHQSGTATVIKAADYQHPADYYCHDCNMTFSNANDFLEHVQNGHDQQHHSTGVRINAKFN